jgi:sphinganine C4-monooxygenase
MAANVSAFDIPPLPEYTTKPLPPLLPWISDAQLSLALPVVAYWAVSLFFHIIDIYDLFPQYRLHTPIELLRKNHATRWDVFRDVILQQVIQTLFGLSITYFDPEPTYGKDDYNVAVWGQRIRLVQGYIPLLFGFLGIDSTKLGTKLGGAKSIVAGVLSGGKYPQLNQVINFHQEAVVAPAFAPWELFLAKAIYWVFVPAIQFTFAAIILDAWQYLLHRGMHMSHWLYSKTIRIPAPARI